MKKLFAILILLVLLAAPGPAGAQRQEICVVCAKGPLFGTIWKHPHGTICKECVNREIKCDICSLPIKDNYLKTTDGRYICKFEKDDVVVDERQAKMFFKQAVQSVMYVSRRAMKLRGPAPEVKLFDIDYWNSGNNMRRGGFSQTRVAGSRFTHNVILLSGLPKDELVSVCAHEYTHLWINENKQANREIEANTIEGICELVAYKVSQRAGFTNQLDRIKKNPYTKGRILTMLEADRQSGFSRILDWVRSGTGATMNVRGVPRSNAPAVSSRSPARPTTPYRPPAATGASVRPRKGLKVTSISRTSRGLRAEINGVLFYQGELKRITYEGRPANMHCLRINGSSVTISINRAQPKVVRLGGN